MEVGEIRIADQSDFDRLRNLCEIHDGWTQVYCYNMTVVWTRANDVSDFNMIKVSALSYIDVFCRNLVQSTYRQLRYCLTTSHFHCTAYLGLSAAGSVSDRLFV